MTKSRTTTADSKTHDRRVTHARVTPGTGGRGYRRLPAAPPGRYYPERKDHGADDRDRCFEPYDG